MSEAEHSFFAMWLARTTIRKTKDVSDTRKRIDHALAAQGLYQSSRRIKETVRALSDISEKFAVEACAELAPLSSRLELLKVANSGVLAFTDTWISDIPKLVATSNGRPESVAAIQAIASSFRSELEMLFDEFELRFIAASEKYNNNALDGASAPASKLEKQSIDGLVPDRPEPRARVAPSLTTAIEAIQSIWGKPPNGLRQKERDKRIEQWCRTRGLTPPRARTIQTAISKLTK